MSTQMQWSRTPWGLGWTLATQSLDPSPSTPNGAGLPSTAPGDALTGAGDDAPDLTGQTGPLSFRQRIGGAIRGLGQVLNPNGGGFESFLSGATGAYTGTSDALQQARLAPILAGQQRDQYAASLGLKRAQTGYYTALGNEAQANAEAPASPTIRQGWDGRWYRLSDDGKSMIPLAGIPANPNAGNGAQTPPQKFYTALTQKYLSMTDPTTGKTYAPDEAAGLAAQSTMTRFPGFTVEGYQPPKQVVTDADIAQLTARFRAAGMNQAQIAQAVEQRRSAGRPHVVGFQPTPNGGGAGAKMSAADRWDALTAGGMSADSATAQVRQEIAAGTVTP